MTTKLTVELIKYYIKKLDENLKQDIYWMEMHPDLVKEWCENIEFREYLFDLSIEVQLIE